MERGEKPRLNRRGRQRGSSVDSSPFEASAGHRHERLQQIIGTELASVLRDEVVDPALARVRFTRCELSADYSSVRAWFAIDSNERYRERSSVEASLERASGFLRARLAGALDLKRTPQLRFVFDEIVTTTPEEGAEP